jgi:MYXO-CTERM domain-containing protein
MKKTIFLYGCLGSLALLVNGHRAMAQTLLDTSGHVALLDGRIPGDVQVTLWLDLDRDGEPSSFETVDATVGDDGSYSARYTPDPTDVDLEFVQFVTALAAAYADRGFEAVLDDGPLPVVLRFERQGYSTVVKRFTTLTDLPTLDVTLVPLAEVHCSEGVCGAPDGSVNLSGFPGGTGIQRAYARAYDPSDDNGLFPGLFADRSENLLISSGFTEIELRAITGLTVTTVSSPISVRFEASPTSWSSLRDQAEGSGRVEVPMYSFDETFADWVPEPDGELENADGTPVDEADFPAILDGSRSDPVFIAFETRHFSTFNCDAPVGARACVKGRLVTGSGEAIVGAQVTVDGLSYSGNAGVVFTGTDGAFASDLMRSERTGEDVDRDGRTGRTFEARVRASAGLGVFFGDPFDSPTVTGTVGATAGVSCRPASCDCLDLGDIVTDFEPPRACEVTVHVTYSGNSRVGSGGPFAAGDPILGASVTGELVGAPYLPFDSAVCATSPCNGNAADADGLATFIVPIVGDTPMLTVKASYTSTEGDSIHSYSGSVRVEGCALGDGSLTGTIELEVGHAGMDDLGSFITSLGSRPPTGGDDAGATPADALNSGCGCRTTGRAPSSRALFVIVAAFGALALARRRRVAGATVRS